MSDSRIPGLLLLTLSSLMFVASTRELLPAASVFPALLLFTIGAVQLLRGQRHAARRARPAAPAVKAPVDRSASSSLRHDLALAERRAMRAGASHQALVPELPSRTEPPRPAHQASGSRADSLPEPIPRPAADIELEDAIWQPDAHDSGAEEKERDDADAGFLVSADVSFPIEVQRGDALADQLRKLSLLLEQGVLSESEYALAKAKLLR